MLLLAILSLTLAVAAPALGRSCPTTSPEENKALAIKFYTQVINDTNFDNLGRFIGDTYIQHDPWVTDGKEGVRTKLRPLLEKGGSKGTLHIARSIAADNFVWLHSKSFVFGKPAALVDIFRVECGKLAEHWDVIMEMVPSEVNDHAYF